VTKSVAEMIGEFLRESGLLILVFIPIDSLLDYQKAVIMWRWLFALFLLGIMAIIIGMAVERSRES
jgi:hypothetical protein